MVRFSECILDFFFLYQNIVQPLQMDNETKLWQTLRDKNPSLGFRVYDSGRFRLMVKVYRMDSGLFFSTRISYRATFTDGK